jgi:hypothetical protein
MPITLPIGVKIPAQVPFIIIDPTVGVLIQGINGMRDNTNLTPMR